MTLYIISKNADPIRPIIKTLCERVGITDYYILDPKSDDIERPFRFALFLEEKPLKASCFKDWVIPLRIHKDMAIEDKQKVLKAFEFIKSELDKFKLQKEAINSGDLPSIKELEVYLNEFKGAFIQLRLQDRRSIGIYPDGEKLLGQSDLEYHVSTLVNMVKIKDLFQPTSIIIKEI